MSLMVFKVVMLCGPVGRCWSFFEHSKKCWYLPTGPLIVKTEKTNTIFLLLWEPQVSCNMTHLHIMHYCKYRNCKRASCVKVTSKNMFTFIIYNHHAILFKFLNPNNWYDVRKSTIRQLNWGVKPSKIWYLSTVYSVSLHHKCIGL